MGGGLGGQGCHFMSGFEVNKIEIGPKWLQSEVPGPRGRRCLKRPFFSQTAALHYSELPARIECHPGPDCLPTAACTLYR